MIVLYFVGPSDSGKSTTLKKQFMMQEVTIRMPIQLPFIHTSDLGF